MQIAIPLFDRLTALDAVGPYEVLQRLPGAEVVFVGHRARDRAHRERVPRAHRRRHLRRRPAARRRRRARRHRDPADRRMPTSPLLDWVAAVHPTTRYTTSVCTGSLVLGPAGLLDGLDATTHWCAYDELRDLGAVPTGGASSSTSTGGSSRPQACRRASTWRCACRSSLVDADAAQAMQLMIEYDPQPPFDAGNVEAAGHAVMHRVIEYSATKD